MEQDIKYYLNNYLCNWFEYNRVNRYYRKTIIIVIIFFLLFIKKTYMSVQNNKMQYFNHIITLLYTNCLNANR